MENTNVAYFESNVKRLAEVLAIQSEIDGMKVANLSGVEFEFRHFDEKAEQLRCVAAMSWEQF